MTFKADGLAKLKTNLEAHVAEGAAAGAGGIDEPR
jgi:hypothetical protein